MRKKTSLSPPMLALRNNAHQVRVLVPNGSTHAVLGTRHPGETDFRAEHVRRWGDPRQSPRQATPAAIEEPLATRSQTALLNRLPRKTQNLLNGGSGEQSASRRAGGEDGREQQLSAPD